MKHKHVAKIEISEANLVKLLGYDGGLIRRVSSLDSEFHYGSVVFEVEHDDLPEVHIGEALMTISYRQ